MTAHGGGALLAEFRQGLGLCGLTDRYLSAPGGNRGSAPSVCGERLMLLLQAGGQRLEDLRALRREAGRRRLDREAMPDPDTLGDGRRRGHPQTGHAGVQGLGAVRDGLKARLVRRDGHATDPLDADATRVEGAQREAPGSDQGVRGSRPLLGVLFETPVCLVDEGRDGKVSPGAGQRACSRQGRARMPVGHRLARDRADRASYQAELIHEWETDQGRWALTADQAVASKAGLAGLPPEAWQAPTRGGGWQVAAAVQTMHATQAACRLSLTREERPPPDLCEAATTP